jgi:hypothetical protein
MAAEEQSFARVVVSKCTATSTNNMNQQFPDRIPYQYWINSQFSIARHYGACTINGIYYVVEPGTNDLVAEHKTIKKQKKRGRRATPTKAEKRFEQWYLELNKGDHKGGNTVKRQEDSTPTE